VSEVAPDALSREQVETILTQGRERAAAARVQADLLTSLQRQFAVTVEPPDPAFDRALVMSVRSGDDAWAVNVSLATNFAYVLREDASQVELITPASQELFEQEQTIMSILAEHGLQVLTLEQLQHPVDSPDQQVGTVFALCFQEGGDPFWEFNWFTGSA
jgi:hypothetical protein